MDSGRTIRSVRLWPAVIAIAVAVVAAASAATIPFRVQLTAPTHTPKANTVWRYSLRVTSLAGKPIAARITVEAIDPTGTAHPFTYANTKKPLVRWPIVGTFHDYATWPAEARGIPLTFRVIVLAKGVRRTLNYAIHVR
jgi:hypothetical protein